MRFRNTRTGELALYADTLIPETITDENDQYEYAIRCIEYLDPADEELGSTPVTRTVVEWRILYAQIPESLRITDDNELCVTIRNAFRDHGLVGNYTDQPITIDIPWGNAMHDLNYLSGCAERPSWYVNGS